MEIKSLISILSGYFVSGRVEIKSLISILGFSLNEHIIVNLSLNDSDNGKILKFSLIIKTKFVSCRT